jgi:ketosteroid isomerase-like protein
MAPDNVERHYRSMRDWNEGGIRALSDGWWADDLEWHDQPNLPDPRVVHGRKQVEAHIDELIAAIGYFTFRVKSAEEVADGVTVAEVELIGEGAPQSGVTVSGSVHQVVHWREGLKTRISTFSDRESAMQEALSSARSGPARSRASAHGP